MNCLTDWFFEDGIRQAKEIDEALAEGGKLKGPLHGVPVALKVPKLSSHNEADIMTK